MSCLNFKGCRCGEEMYAVALMDVCGQHSKGRVSEWGGGLVRQAKWKERVGRFHVTIKNPP